MDQIARTVIAGVAHHITQRGNNRQDVLFAENDKHVYLEYLHDQSDQYGLTITGCCLMNNHIHVIGMPETAKLLTLCPGMMIKTV